MTRVSTQNAGNEALSVELINFVLGQAPDAETRVLDRYPRTFEHLRINQLTRGDKNLTDAFDALARSLTQRFHSDANRLLAPLADEKLVKLDQTAKELPSVMRRVKRKIGFRRNLARLGLIGRDETAATVGTCAWADILIWNPAGEFHPTGSPDEAFRLLLVIRIAQMLGARVAIVNHSLEVSDLRLRQLVQHVYGKSDYIGVRDARSAQEALSLGLPETKIFEAPDLVFLASTTSASQLMPDEQFEEGAICFAINGLEAFRGVNEWDQLFTNVKLHGRQLVFLSNAMNHDIAFARSVAERHGGLVVDRQPGYRELRRFYRRMGVLVSSRLHASILALCEGTPVVSLEPSVFKLKAIFEQLRYPIPTDDTATPRWAERLTERIDRALLERDALAEFGKQTLDEQVSRIKKAYQPVFQQAPGHVA